jgi:hypothetical protein
VLKHDEATGKNIEKNEKVCDTWNVKEHFVYLPRKN